MKHFPIVLFGLLFTISLSCCQEEQLEVEELSEEEVWLNQLCSIEFAGRCVETDGNKRAASYIREILKGKRYVVEDQPFIMDDIQGDNLIITIKGTCDTLIVIGAHYDGAHESAGFLHFPAANDNASGVVCLISLMSKVMAYNISPHYTVQFAFWDAEESHKGNSRRGSRYFVSQLDNKDLLKLYINLDTVGYVDDDYMWMGAFQCSRSEGYINRIREGLLLFNLEYDNSMNWDACSDDWSFRLKGIPTIAITDCCLPRHQYPLHTSKDLPTNVDINKLKLISSVLFNSLFF